MRTPTGTQNRVAQREMRASCVCLCDRMKNIAKYDKTQSQVTAQMTVAISKRENKAEKYKNDNSGTTDGFSAISLSHKTKCHSLCAFIFFVHKKAKTSIMTIELTQCRKHAHREQRRTIWVNARGSYLRVILLFHSGCLSVRACEFYNGHRWKLRMNSLIRKLKNSNQQTT